MVNIDLDFVSRNWLLLARLSRMGYNREEATLLAEKIEVEEICFKNLVRNGELQNK